MNKKLTRKISLTLCIALLLGTLSAGSLGTDTGSITVKAQTTKTKEQLSNPTIDSNGVSTWDCIYFGNYWQNDTNGDGKANKKDAREPIKWRVLSVNGDDAFLLADQNLDCQTYNDTRVDVTWETCTMRSWLNGYGAGSNVYEKDYTDNNFLDNAFSAREQSAIQNTTVVNADNPSYSTKGGNGTTDKVYLLSIDEVLNPSYGFTSTTGDTKTREARNTAYATAQGVYTRTEYAGNGRWWLRSPGYNSFYASIVAINGDVNRIGNGVDTISKAVRPALHLNLSSTSGWSYAGQVTSNHTVKNIGAKTSTTYKTYQTASAYQTAYKKKMKRSWKEILADGKDGIDFTKSFAQPGVITTNYTVDDKTYQNNGNYIPQGICYAGDSKNAKKYRIISAYNAEAKKYPSVLYVMEQEGNSANYTYRTTLILNEKTHTHNGGVAFDGENLWVCKPNECIGYIKYATLEKAIQKAEDDGVYSVLVSYDEESIPVAKHPSFLTYAHGKLWIGNYFGKEETKKGVLIGYEIQNKKSKVSLRESVAVNNLPSSSQGAYIEGDNLYVSFSYGSTKMSNTSRIARYSVPGLKENRICIQLGQPEVVHEVPKMNEEILIDGDTIYTVFESSANKWMDARLITDRVLAFDKSLWTGNGTRSQKMLTSYLAAAQRSADERYEEGTEETVSYQYDFNEELDEREKVFTFTPSESGTYKITLAGLEAEDDLYAHLEMEDEDVCTYGVLSTCTDEGAAREEREPVAGAEVETGRVEVESGTSEKTDYVGTEAEGEFVLSEGITYYFSMYVDSLSSADTFSGQYTFKAERVGGLDVQELSGTGKTVVTELNDEMNYIRFVPEESGYYRICSELSSDAEMGGLRVMKGFREEVALNEDCAYLDKGEEYYILFDIEGLIDSEATATIWMEPYVSDILKAGEALSVTGSSVLEYVAEEDGEVIVYSSSKNGNPTVFVYDEDGNLVSCSTNSTYDLSENENDFAAVFTAEKGKKYRIIINSANGSQMEIRIGDYEEVTNPEPTASPTAEPTFTPEPTASAKPVSSQTPTPSGEETKVPGETAKPGHSAIPSAPSGTVEPQAVPLIGPTVQTTASGDVIVVKKLRYRVTNTAKRTVSCIGATKKNQTTLGIPDTVKYDGKTWQVTAIADNAFKNQKKLKTLTIGKNVTKIGKNAFRGCKKLKVITIRGKKLKTVGSAALKGINGKAVIKVPKAKKKQYTKLFRKKGQKSIKIV